MALLRVQVSAPVVHSPVAHPAVLRIQPCSKCRIGCDGCTDEALPSLLSRRVLHFARLGSARQPVVRACVQRASQSCWQPCCASSRVRNAGSGVTGVADEALPSLLSRGVLHFAQETAPEFVPREVTIDAALNGSGRRSTRRYSRAACPMRRVWHRHPEESAPRHQFPQRALGTALPTPRRAYLRL